MDEMFDVDHPASLSSDSGFESADDTRPSSTVSAVSFYNGIWEECSTLIFSLSDTNADSFIQNLCSGLLSSNVNTIKTSARQLLYLCRLGFTKSVLSTNEIFDALKLAIVRIDVSMHPDLVHCISGIFYYLTENINSVSLIPTDSIIAFLIHLLSFPLESALFYTVSGLHNLLDHKCIRDKLRTPPIVTLLVQILWTCFLYDKSFHPPVTCNFYLTFISSNSMSKFLSVVCDSIYLLAHGNDTTKRLIHVKKGVVPLLYFVHTYPFEKVQGVCVRLLRILSTHSQIKKDIVKNDPTMRFFKHSSTSNIQGLSLNALWTLRNISDQCSSISNHQINEISESLLKRLRTIESALPFRDANIISHYDTQELYAVYRCVSGTLANFTCRNPFTKILLVENGAIPLLLRLLSFSLNDLSAHNTVCSYISVGGQCISPVNCDPVPLSFLSCTCGRRSLPLSVLQGTIDCVEATLRCLSHLTSSHRLVGEALHQLMRTHDDDFLSFSKNVCWIVDLLQITTDGEKDGDHADHAIRLVPEQRDILDTHHVIQLAKSWLSLARNCLAGNKWKTHEQETALKSGIRYLEANLNPLLEALDHTFISPGLQDTADFCRQLLESIRQF